MFFVGFLLSYVIPIFCTTIAFNLLSCCIINCESSQGEGRAVSLMQCTDGWRTCFSSSLYFFSQLIAKHNLTSQSMLTRTTPKEGTMQYTR